MAFEQVDPDLAQGIAVGRGVAAADAAVIFSEGEVQHPKQRVLDTPMATHGIGEGLGIARSATPMPRSPDQRCGWGRVDRSLTSQ